MSVTASLVKELRDKTGAGMLDAKNALVESDGDIEKASELLRQKGLATAAKKAGRQAAEGKVEAMVSADGQSGILIEVNCETDFVGKGDAFGDLVDKLAKLGLEKKPADLQAFLATDYQGQSIDAFITDSISQIKEKISLRRFEVVETQGNGLINTYIHTGGKIGVLTALSFENSETASKPEVQALAKDLCMQIASAGADFVRVSDIPADVVEEEKRVEMGKEDLQSKPEDIRAKIVEGRVQKLMAQRVLLEQAFVKDPSKTINELVAELSKQVGDTVSVSRFVRFVLGEGIEKKQENFAEEVMAQLK